MREYIVKRLLLLVPVMLGVSAIVFTVMRLVPGDIALLILGDQATEETVALLHAQLGLDRPLWVQYLSWIWNLLHLDFGQSIWTHTAIAGEILRRLPVSLELTFLAMVVSLLIAIPAGIVSAVRQDTLADQAARLLAIAGLSVPEFWLGTMLIVFPAMWFHWLPPIIYVPIWQDPLANVSQFVLPALAVGAHMAGSVTRMTRSALLEVLRQDYVRTARAKGLRERVLVSRHALKNAMMPVITLTGNQLGRLLGGTVIVETVFSLPGLGRLTVDAIFHRDYPQLETNVLLMAMVFVTVNLLIDLSYGWLDPRIHYK